MNNEMKRRLAMTVAGVLIAGFSVGMFQYSALGLDPFQVFAHGVWKRINGPSFGFVYMVLNMILLAVDFFFLDRRHLYQPLPSGLCGGLLCLALEEPSAGSFFPDPPFLPDHGSCHHVPGLRSLLYGRSRRLHLRCYCPDIVGEKRLGFPHRPCDLRSYLYPDRNSSGRYARDRDHHHGLFHGASHCIFQENGGGSSSIWKEQDISLNLPRYRDELCLTGMPVPHKKEAKILRFLSEAVQERSKSPASQFSLLFPWPDRRRYNCRPCCKWRRLFPAGSLPVRAEEI